MRLRANGWRNYKGKKMARQSFKDFKKKALSDPKVKAAYDELGSVFELKRKLISMRKESGLTQAQMADMLKTAKGNISRLENISSGHVPNFATIQRYAEACGYKTRVEFERT